MLCAAYRSYFYCSQAVQFLRPLILLISDRASYRIHSIIREKVPMNSKLSLSDECERPLAYAEEEAANLSRECVGPEHLVLGLLREEGSFAAQLLREHGAELDRIRRGLSA
jgi:ATP-dependent Clp protease ATP-binding subunit ClpC